MSIETRTEYHARRASEEHADAITYAGLVRAPLHRRMARAHRVLARELQAGRGVKKTPAG